MNPSRARYPKLFFKLIFMTLLSFFTNSACAKSKTNFPKLEKEVLSTGGKNSAERFLRWEEMLKTSWELSERQKIETVNRFFNQEIGYQSDKSLYQKNDHWASLSETLMNGQGDCEDYAIAKYVTLRILNVDDKKLNLMEVVHQSSGSLTSHMVLVYQDSKNSDKKVLDNIDTTIKNLENRTDLSVRYSFNSKKVWIGLSSYKFEQVKNKFSKWHDVLAKTSYSGLSLG